MFSREGGGKVGEERKKNEGEKLGRVLSGKERNEKSDGGGEFKGGEVSGKEESGEEEGFCVFERKVDGASGGVFFN